MKKQYNTMNLSTFLSHYFGINSDNLGKLRHKDIASIFPELPRSSYEAVRKNPELLYTGKIVMVKDCKNNVIPYIVPKTTYMSYSGADAVVECNSDIKYDNCDVNNLNTKVKKGYTNVDMSRNIRNLSIEFSDKRIILRKEIKNEIINSIDKMSSWELKKLMRKYKPYYSIYKRAKKELNKRGGNQHSYRLKRLTKTIEKDDYNDKY